MTPRERAAFLARHLWLLADLKLAWRLNEQGYTPEQISEHVPDHGAEDVRHMLRTYT